MRLEPIWQSSHWLQASRWGRITLSAQIDGHTPILDSQLKVKWARAIALLVVIAVVLISI